MALHCRFLSSWLHTLNNCRTEHISIKYKPSFLDFWPRRRINLDSAYIGTRFHRRYFVRGQYARQMEPIPSFIPINRGAKYYSYRRAKREFRRYDNVSRLKWYTQNETVNFELRKWECMSFINLEQLLLFFKAISTAFFFPQNYTYKFVKK